MATSGDEGQRECRDPAYSLALKRVALLENFGNERRGPSIHSLCRQIP